MERDEERRKSYYGSLEMGSKTSLTRKVDRNLAVIPQYIRLGLALYLFILAN